MWIRINAQVVATSREANKNEMSFSSENKISFY